MKISEIAKINENSLSAKDDWDFVNYLDTGNITQNQIDEIQYYIVGKDKIPSRAKRKVKNNSIVYSTVRPNQCHYGIIKTQPENFVVSTGFAVIDVDERLADAEYIYAYLTQQTIIDELQSIAEQSTSTYPAIKPSDLGDLEISLPSLEEQKKIASILNSLEYKMQNNREINNNLEQQAQALYKAWFIDFLPYEGVKPTHWSTVPLGSMAKISTEIFSPQKNPNVEVEHYSIPAYDEKHYPMFEISDGIKSNKYKLTANSVIISKLNPDTKRIWRPYCLSSNPICSTEFIVYEPIIADHRDFLYSVIDSSNFSAFLCSHTTGSTNSRQRATPSITLNYEIALPDEKVLQKFCSTVAPIYDTIENSIIENQILAKTRDTLLPRLMSGEIDVSDIDF